MSTREEIAKHIYRVEKMPCNCHLDAWQPEIDTGHSWGCRIHKETVARHRTGWAVPIREITPPHGGKGG